MIAPNTRQSKGLGSEEASPEKAGVGGSIPSLATTSFQRLSPVSVSQKCLPGVQTRLSLEDCA